MRILQTLKEKLGLSCQAAFIGAPVHPSASQQQVSDTLRGMGLSVEDEFRCPKSGYSIDMRVHDMRVNAKSSTGAAAGWAVEFDGPTHFLTCMLPVGGTLMKRRHLELLGYTVVSLPFWEWGRLTGSDERKKYLRGKLFRTSNDSTKGGSGAYLSALKRSDLQALAKKYGIKANIKSADIVRQLLQTGGNSGDAATIDNGC